MPLSLNKTKIVCTIGPASESEETMRHLLLAGMNVARLNFSHGNFSWHKNIIEKLREAARLAGKHVTIMADLPGPKIRVGELGEEPIELKQGNALILTTDEITGDQCRVSVGFPRLPVVVNPGNIFFINDGNIKLEVVAVEGNEVKCRVLVGGELRSRKGVNLPGLDLGICAFTQRDHECMAFALENGVDAISQSFVETAADIDAVRQAATNLGYQPFIIAKIERAGALKHVDEILKVSDGIMVARGDLGVETPLERMAVVQKQLIQRANQVGKPVITATQMLESMVNHSRPTRAEATDVANAILDGTDCVMLSEESAMGKYPIEAVMMLAGIAAATEPSRRTIPFSGYVRDSDIHLVDLISRNVQHTAIQIEPVAVLVPTITGYTARMVSRFRLPMWIAGVSPNEATCAGLQFSYGVSPVYVAEHPNDWNLFARHWVHNEGLPEGRIVLTEGPSQYNPDANPRLEIMDIGRRRQD